MKCNQPHTGFEMGIVSVSYDHNNYTTCASQLETILKRSQMFIVKWKYLIKTIYDMMTNYLSEFLRRGLKCNILCVIFWTIIHIFIVVTQCFGHCIHWPSSGVPCLSGQRNDSTREIIFKV